jgi:hypothetical protein
MSNHIRNILVLYTIVSGAVTLVMVLANVFFENKRLLLYTLVPAVICLALVTILVGTT